MGRRLPQWCGAWCGQAVEGNVMHGLPSEDDSGLQCIYPGVFVVLQPALVQQVSSGPVQYNMLFHW